MNPVFAASSDHIAPARIVRRGKTWRHGTLTVQRHLRLPQFPDDVALDRISMGQEATLSGGSRKVLKCRNIYFGTHR